MDRPDERLVAEFTHQAESFNKSPVMNMQQTTGSHIALLPLALHHMPEPGRCVAEMARVVRPGGWVAVASAPPHDACFAVQPGPSGRRLQLTFGRFLWRKAR